MFHEAFDGAAFAGCVAPLAQDDNALACFLYPALHLEQFDLQVLLGRFVFGPAHLGLVGVVGIGEYLLLAETLDFLFRGKRRRFPVCREFSEGAGVMFGHGLFRFLHI